MTTVTPPARIGRRARTLILLGVVVVLGAAPLLGAPMLLVIVVAGTPWVFALMTRGIRVPLATVASSALVFFLLLATLIVTAVTPFDPLWALSVVFVLLGCAGVLLIPAEKLTPRWSRMPVRGVLAALAPLTGAAVWLGARALSAVLPQGSAVAWATLNDAANSVMFGRQILIDGGVRLGITENPVPLVASLIAANTLPGRESTDAVARHDVLAFVDTWSLLVAALCIAAGLLARQLLREASPVVVVLGTALVSTLPLSWLITGLSFEYGYVNVPPTLILLIGSLIAFFAARESPALAFATIVASGALMMTSWSPLTLMPALLAAAVLVLHWRALLRSATVVKIALGALLLLTLGFAAAFVLPTFGASKDAIESDVSFYPLRIRSLLVVLAVAGVLSLALGWKRKSIDAVVALAAIAVGGGAAIGVFLYARRAEQQLWAYYSYKALWFLLMILVILAAAYGVALIADLTRRWWVGLIALVGLGASTVAYGSFANSVPLYGSMNAVDRIVSGTVLIDNEGDEVWDQIFELADADPHAILWKTSEPNRGFIDFWLIKLASPGFDDIELHTMAYLLDQSDVDDLCRFAELTGPALNVVTEDPGIADDVAQCGNPDITVTVVETR